MTGRWLTRLLLQPVDVVHHVHERNLPAARTFRALVVANDGGRLHQQNLKKLKRRVVKQLLCRPGAQFR